MTPLHAIRKSGLRLQPTSLRCSSFAGLCGRISFLNSTSASPREKGISAQEEKARKAADKADGEKTRFIASASHDLRQPVSSLVLNFEAHLAAHPEYVTDPAVTDMRSSIDSLSTMLESILTVSKLDAKVLCICQFNGKYQ